MDFIFHYQSSWLIPMLPFLSAFVAGFGLISFRLPTRSLRHLYGLISTITVFFSMIISMNLLWKYIIGHSNYCFLFPWIVNDNISLKLGFFIDPLSSLMLFLVTSVAVLVMSYSHGYMSHDQSYVRFFAYLSLFTASMLGLVLSPNLFQIYIFWELVGMCSYLLIGFWFTRPNAASACQKAFITNRIGDFCLLLGILGLYWFTNSFDFITVTKRTEEIISNNNSHLYFFIFCSFLLFCGPIAKSAQFPLHIWLPDAMEGPTPISALIHAATMVAAGIFLVARLFPLFQLFPSIMNLITCIGILTAFLGSTIALSQIDLKKSLAYSTISQLGYMMVAMGIGSYKAGLFHLVTHAYSKALLFLGSGSVIHNLEPLLGYNPENNQNLVFMGGLGKSMPITRFTFLIGTLSLCGVPPFACFWSKDEIIADAWKYNFNLGLIAWITAGLTGFYMFRVYLLAFEGDFRGIIFLNKNNLKSTKEVHESNLYMLIPLIILSFLSLFIGFISTPFHDYLYIFLDSPIVYDNETSYFQILLNFSSIGVALIGMIIAYSIYAYNNISIDFGFFKRSLKKIYFEFYQFSFSKWYIEVFYHSLFLSGTRNLAQLLFYLDQWLFDGVVNLTGISTLLGGQSLKYKESGRVSSYLFSILIGALVLFFFLPLHNSQIGSN
uniref:NAD(P)H-quinone oxidoreductase subunit 5, chloroplastic n=1 Tax=Chara vulgaris TaxID=55564 RepID=NU5C_CHAVU|nr:NADH dehydrogenase subunit 5 [Chara vulgaris]Q1ACF3.1 RecName: Full=NAD(P)H-quinone oxidoreductase subunit 5, chloroplastic; AltName: Full=NAD(P)H dehydrogenase subunit 5; AltName: Full=NADH-plastoquinone oxidoreductase subunit 5 [Chara vulgaris]ABA61924.1 subunit 5 of NADH-plastoquinone oxidoreductase [Chara vulgaris]WAP91359.1 NADH dehydrogenase subunit 5 [Chara vulgaris]